MQTEYVYPMVGDRSNPKEWVEQGRPDAVARAQKKLKQIMNNHYPAHIPAAVDDAIRAKFPVRLDRAHMRKG
jgi:trimethylamine--corrinoid protein Co-methyltransferase